MAMGPNAVWDLAGLDVGHRMRQERTDLPDDPQYYRIADKLAESGRFGQKTGKGTYRYEPGSRVPIPMRRFKRSSRAKRRVSTSNNARSTTRKLSSRCIIALIVEGARILEDGCLAASRRYRRRVDSGYGFPRHRGGPMHCADTIGVDRVYATVCEYRERFGPMYWEVPELLKDLATSGRRFADL